MKDKLIKYLWIGKETILLMIISGSFRQCRYYYNYILCRPQSGKLYCNPWLPDITELQGVLKSMWIFVCGYQLAAGLQATFHHHLQLSVKSSKIDKQLEKNDIIQKWSTQKSNIFALKNFQPLRLLGGCRDTNVLQIQMPQPPRQLALEGSLPQIFGGLGAHNCWY